MELGAVGDIVVDAHGEGIGLLEHHAHPAAQVGELHLPGKDILALQPDIALDADARHQIVHPVQGLEKGRFAAAGRADEGSDLPLAHIQRDALEGLEIAVPEIQVLGRDHRRIVIHNVTSHILWGTYPAQPLPRRISTLFFIVSASVLSWPDGLPGR